MMAFKALRRVAGGLVDEAGLEMLGCPTCGASPLSILSLNSAPRGGTRHDRVLFGMGEHGPERFAGLLSCPSHRTWCDPVTVVGIRYPALHPEPPDPGEIHVEAIIYEPWYIDPPLPLLDLHPSVPAVFHELGRAASAVMWLDAAAAANRLRSAAESFLDNLEVPRTETNKSGGSHVLSLGKRAGKATSTQEVKKLLDGIRVLGNEGSHGSDITTENIIEGAEIFSLMINEHYPRTEDHKVAKTAHRWATNNRVD